MTDFAGLKSDIVAFYKNRSDIASSANSLVSYSESYLNTKLRCREMEYVDTLTPDSITNACTLPDDYLEYKRVVELASIRRRLDYVTEDSADGLYPTRPAGMACHFMIVGNDLTALPLSANDIELTYYQRIPALSETNTTNWLLTKFPNLYLHTCLMYAAELTKDEEQLTKEAVFVERLIGDLQGLDNRGKFGNAGMTLSGVYW